MEIQVQPYESLSPQTKGALSKRFCFRLGGMQDWMEYVKKPNLKPLFKSRLTFIARDRTGAILGWAWVASTPFWYDFKKEQLVDSIYVFVRDHHRGKGVGKELVLTALLHFSSLRVWPHDDISHRFYIKLGMEQDKLPNSHGYANFLKRTTVKQKFPEFFNVPRN